MERLGDYTDGLKKQATRFTAGRFLQALARSNGDAAAAQAWVEQSRPPWLDRDQVIHALKAAVTPLASGDYPGAFVPIADSFLAAVRSQSVPRQLALRRVPMLTRLFIDSTGIVAVEVAEDAAIPVLKGNWTDITLTPRKHAGIAVQSVELVHSNSITAAAAITDDLSAGVADSENTAFVNPNASNSVFAGQAHFTGSGGTLAQVDADLKRLVDLVPGAWRPGAAFVMSKETATYLALLRGSGGDAAYEDITPQGGELLGLPVIITIAASDEASPPTRIIGLVDPSQVFFADEGHVELTASKSAALKQDDAATNAPGSVVSMFQTNAIALKAQIESAWYARSGAGAYFVAGF